MYLIALAVPALFMYSCPWIASTTPSGLPEPIIISRVFHSDVIGVINNLNCCSIRLSVLTIANALFGSVINITKPPTL